MNIHDSKIEYVQENSNQRKGALIAVLHLKVTVTPFCMVQSQARIHTVLVKGYSDLYQLPRPFDHPGPGMPLEMCEPISHHRA